MKKYLFFLLLIFSLKNASSQMYFAGTMFQSYNDVNPDTLLNYVVAPYTNETFGLNLFDDGAADVLLTAHGAVSSSGSSAYLNVMSVNPKVYILFGRWDSVYVPGSSSWDVTKVAKPLIVADPIDAPGAIWDNGTLYLTDHSGHSGGNKTVNDWVGTDKYLGIKYENGSSVSYGWIRLRCPGEDSCYVKDLSTTLVVIGEREFTEGSIELFPNPVQAGFYLKNANDMSLDLSRFTLTNVFGQPVNFSYEMVGADVKINPADNLPPGCYTFRCYSDKNVFSKKIIRTHE